MRTRWLLGGLAILEDANHHTAQLTAVRVDEMERREEELLALAKSWMGRIPMALNILILDEIGKNYSGAGMDTKVVNRGVNGEYNPWDTAPHFDRVFVRGFERTLRVHRDPECYLDQTPCRHRRQQRANGMRAQSQALPRNRD